MAITSTNAEMLKESLPDMMNGAKICISYEKKEGGCLGYPAALLLFSIADTIASYHEGDVNFKIKVDGKVRLIKTKGFQRFFIFNSCYYDLGLSEEFIKTLYDNYRSLLVHNGVLTRGHFIDINHPLGFPFDESGYENEDTGEKYPSVSLMPFWQHSIFAVSKFLENIDQILLTSKQAQNIKRKDKF